MRPVVVAQAGVPKDLMMISGTAGAVFMSLDRGILKCECGHATFTVALDPGLDAVDLACVSCGKVLR